jgi:hypothetical protein
MTSRDFAFWLQGFLEVTDAKTIGVNETEIIKRHLNLVFKHEIDPSYTDDPKKQDELNQIHSGAQGSDKPVMRC